MKCIRPGKILVFLYMLHPQEVLKLNLEFKTNSIMNIQRKSSLIHFASSILKGIFTQIQEKLFISLMVSSHGGLILLYQQRRSPIKNRHCLSSFKIKDFQFNLKQHKYNFVHHCCSELEAEMSGT